MTPFESSSRKKGTRTLYLAVSLLWMLGAYHGSPAWAASLPGYDFSYDWSGNPALFPVQVFNDGRNTYFEFSSSFHLPAIFIQASGGDQCLVLGKIQPPYVIVKGLARRYALKLSGMALAHVKYEGLQQFASPRIASYPAVREPASQGSLPALEDPYKKQEEGVKGHSCWPVLMKHTLLSSGPPHPALLAVPRTYSGSMALPAGHGRATRGRTGVGTVSRKVALRHRTSPSLLPAAPALPLRPKAALADAQARKPAFITRTAVPLSRRFEGGLNQKKGLTRQSSQVMPPEPGLVMQPHQHLSHVLRHYLAARGVSLVWQVPGDFELLQSWTVPGHSQQQVILRALNQFNLEGTLYARNRTLVVTPSSGFGRGQGG